MSGKDISERPGDGVAAFVEQLRNLPSATRTSARGRLIFALDATASRQPTWDLAIHVQNEMFLEAGRLGGLDVQLLFYRGFGECRSSAWLRDGAELVRLMRAVSCVAGKTQIAKVLRHAAQEARRRPVQALVFVGDCMEENVDELGHLAGEELDPRIRAVGCVDGRLGIRQPVEHLVQARTVAALERRDLLPPGLDRAGADEVLRHQGLIAAGVERCQGLLGLRVAALRVLPQADNPDPAAGLPLLNPMVGDLNLTGTLDDPDSVNPLVEFEAEPNP